MVKSCGSQVLSWVDMLISKYSSFSLTVLLFFYVVNMDTSHFCKSYWNHITMYQKIFIEESILIDIDYKQGE